MDYAATGGAIKGVGSVLAYTFQGLADCRTCTRGASLELATRTPQQFCALQKWCRNCSRGCRKSPVARAYEVGSCRASYAGHGEYNITCEDYRLVYLRSSPASLSEPATYSRTIWSTDRLEPIEAKSAMMFPRAETIFIRPRCLAVAPNPHATLTLQCRNAQPILLK